MNGKVDGCQIADPDRGLSNRRILVVDDNQAIHGDFAKILAEPATGSGLGAAALALFDEPEQDCELPVVYFDLAFAQQGQEALELVQQSMSDSAPFAVAFVDMRMPPGWDGLTTIEQIWKVDPRIFVVICTAYNDHRWSDMSRRLGHHHAWQVLKKPFDSVEVRQLACSLAEKWALARAAELKQEELERLVEERTNRAIEAQKKLLRLSKHRAIGGLARGVAHQFNNYLQVIEGYTRFVMTSIAEGSEAYDDLKNVLAASEKAAELSSQLLAFSENAPMATKKIRLDDCVREFEFAVRSCLGSNYDVRLETSSNATIYADLSRLREAILNLCLNARDAMPDGGVVTIRTSVEQVGEDDCPSPESSAGTYARLEVTDHGIGMSAEVRERAVEPFFTTKDVGEGIGLGLSMTAGIMRQLGGFLRIESEPGEGTTVSLCFPLSAHAPKSELPELDIDELCGGLSVN